MVQPVKVQQVPSGQLIKKPSYLLELEAKWKRWTKIDDKEAYEALKDLSGDLWGELRKLEAQLCKEIENRQLPDDFKEFAKARIRDTWRDIIGHQKIGLDKLCIVVRKYLKEE
jgi:hypothetical protein